MICRCGYNFVEAALAGGSVVSYAVVNDADYQLFLKREMRVKAARGKEAKFRALARSAELVGSLKVCPVCGRLRFLKPGGEEVELLEKIDER